MHSVTRIARLLGLTCLTAGLLSAGPVQAGLLNTVLEGGPKRVELSAETDIKAAYKEAFAPKGLLGSAPDPVGNGIRKVAIAGFQVEFATEQKGISKGGGSSAGIMSTTDVVYTMKGTTPLQMQAVTDRLYEGFVALLKARGYEVLPSNALSGTSYADALAKANQPPRLHERGTALDLVYTPSDKEVDNASIIASAKDTAPDVFTQFLAQLGPGQQAADALQANILHIRLKMNFARFEETGFFMPDIDGKPQNTLGTAGTFVQVYSPGGGYSLYPLTNSVILPGRVAAEAVPVAASTEQTAQRAAGGVGRVALGLFKGIGGIGDVVAGTTATAHSTMASGNFEVAAGPDYEDLIVRDGTLALGLIGAILP